MSAFDVVTATPWAILPDFLTAIAEIAAREAVTPEAVQARLGRPMENAHRATRRDGVATIPVSGPIFRHANLFTHISGASSIATMATDLRAALDDPAVRAVILEIDSPGGQVAGTAEFAAMVRAAEKPVHAYVDGTGASAAYWIAAAADSITLSPTAMVGSIGVVSTHVRRDERSRTVEVVSSQSPDKRLDVDKEGDRAKIQATVDALGGLFVAAVAEFRGVSPEAVVRDFGAGGCLVGESAVAVGMADRVGSYESLLADLARGREVPGRRPPKTKGHSMSTETAAQPTADPTAEARPTADVVTLSAAEFREMQEQMAALTRDRQAAQDRAFAAQLEAIGREAREFAGAQARAGRLVPAAARLAAVLHAQSALEDAGIASHVATLGADGAVTIVSADSAAGRTPRADQFAAFVAALPEHELFGESIPATALSNDAGAGDPYKAAYETTVEAERKANERRNRSKG